MPGMPLMVFAVPFPSRSGVLAMLVCPNPMPRMSSRGAHAWPGLGQHGPGARQGDGRGRPCRPDRRSPSSFAGSDLKACRLHMFARCISLHLVGLLQTCPGAALGGGSRCHGGPAFPPPACRASQPSQRRKGEGPAGSGWDSGLVGMGAGEALSAPLVVSVVARASWPFSVPDGGKTSSER
jgi:hypothetical protein